MKYLLLAGIGAMALAWSMDKIGPMCRSVADCAEVLRILGCDAIQGWAIAHPMDAPALARWLDGRRIGVGGR